MCWTCVPDPGLGTVRTSALTITTGEEVSTQEVILTSGAVSLVGELRLGILSQLRGAIESQAVE